MIELTVILHEVTEDGLPDMKDDDLIGRVAFVWDGCVVSGWPIGPEYDDSYDPADVKWEPSEDRFGGPVRGVTRWLELPRPAWDLAP